MAQQIEDFNLDELDELDQYEPDLTGFLFPQPTDEEFVIPFWSGDPEAIDRMWEKARSLSTQELLITWRALKSYDPRNYYDKAGKIGMDDWCYVVTSILDERGVQHYA
jgi:hypothetical protein